MVNQLAALKQIPAEEHFERDEEKEQTNPFKPATPARSQKKVNLEDLRQKGIQRHSNYGYISAGEDSDMPYFSDNQV